RRAAALAAPTDHDALEELRPLLLALDDLHVHADRVTGGESRPVLLELYRLDQSNRVHDRIPFRRIRLSSRGRRAAPASPPAQIVPPPPPPRPSTPPP